MLSLSLAKSSILNQKTLLFMAYLSGNEINSLDKKREGALVETSQLKQNRAPFCQQTSIAILF
jgi:hypothetical protein